MLRESVRAMFNDAQRGDDRAGSDAAPGKPPVLRRRTIQLVAILVIAAIVYGSLAPFQIDRTHEWSWTLRPSQIVPGDIISNILIYVPVGLCARLLFRRRASLVLTEWFFGLTIPIALSYLTEATQTILLNRIPSWYDVGANGLGAAIGVAIAPIAQKLLRNQHAWLYHELRTRPFSAAAIGMTCAIFFAGLMPFDLKPSPSHIARSLAHLRNAVHFAPFVQHAGQLPQPVDVVNKLTSAGTYSLLAFLMVLAAAHARKPLNKATRYAIRRTIALAALLEGLQLFTISHTADPWDFAFACLFAVLGCAAAKVWLESEPMPRPGPALRAVVTVMAMGVALRLAFAVSPISLAPRAAIQSWLPMAGQFHRPWSAVLGSYSSGFLLYAIIAGLVMLWCRSHRRVPRTGLLTLVTFAPIALGALIALATGRGLDTAQAILAGLAVALILGVDRALFSHHARPATN